MRERGLDAWVRDQHRRGATVIGICGGFQMLGEAIHDPAGVESTSGTRAGPGTAARRNGADLGEDHAAAPRDDGTGAAFAAYEIHLGQTTSAQPLAPFAQLEDGTAEGVRGERLVGTYLHGALEDAGVCSEMFGVPVAAGSTRGAEYAALADWFERYAEHPESWLPA